MLAQALLSRKFFLKFIFIMNIQEFKKRYWYEFPAGLIAQHPARPRDAARLLVCDKTTGETRVDTFSHLAQYLPPKSVLVLNDTKVLPARLTLHKKTGGVVEALYVRDVSPFRVAVLLNKGVVVGDELLFRNKPVFKVVERLEKEWVLELLDVHKRPVDVWIAHGTVPLPPYIKHASKNKKQNERDYQTVFGKHRGSVAAPTASLHFTNRLLQKLRTAGHTVCFVTLHVNLGTFAPVSESHLVSGTLHSEYFSVPAATAKTIAAAKQKGQAIIPVGTTALRTLESGFDKNGVLVTQSGMTNLFIQEGYDFKIATALITNFHVPQSSLLALVCTFAGYTQVMEWYRKAITGKFRLFSFGDGMMIF